MFKKYLNMYPNCDLCILWLFPLYTLHVYLKNVLGLTVRLCLPLLVCTVPCGLLPHLHPIHMTILLDSNCEVQNMCKWLKEKYQVWDWYVSLKFSTLFLINLMHFQFDSKQFVTCKWTISVYFQHNIGIPLYKRGLPDRISY